ncbi:MAG: hypothetical protein HUK25_00070 [Treponema sp.]|nr:hypothetical protein [Treponema sp.]
MEKLILNKKYLVAGLIFILSVLCFAKGKKDKVVKDNTLEISGTLVSYGNEPFTYPVFVADDETIYCIRCEKDIMDGLIEAWGRRITVTGTILKPEEVEFNTLDSIPGSIYLKITGFKISTLN